jgi:tetratricopeptide (TPR) repeat protein
VQAAILTLLLLAGPGAATHQVSQAMTFEDVANRATRAREKGALEEAIQAYGQAVEIRPSWEEGWWHLGALRYATDRWAGARIAFDRFLVLRPDFGPALALRGLCKFELREYPAALEDLARAVSLGSLGNPEINRAGRLHLALLRIQASQFERAIAPLQSLVAGGGEMPGVVVDACGLMLLRKSWLPSEIPPERRELVRAAGQAACSGLTPAHDETRRLFEELLARYPDVPNLHYGFGLFIRESDPEASLDAHRREIEIQPEAVLPRLEIALGLLYSADPKAALPYAEEAVRLAPTMAAAHHVLGQVLLGQDEVAQAVTEMERAVRLAPESPEMRFGLVQAYQRAGRSEDVARERAVFVELEAQQ